MVYLLLSVLCSVSVGVFFKIIKKKKDSEFFQLIMWNYVVATILLYIFYQPNINSVNILLLSKNSFLLLIILLPLIFLIQAKSIIYVGIVKTDIAQRLSLIISLTAAFFIYQEKFSLVKIIALVMGVISIIFILLRQEKHKEIIKWQYPILVLVGFGVIDILFKQIATQKNVEYTTALFFIFLGAFILSFIINIYQYIVRKSKLLIVYLYRGILLGLLNFGNILFYLKAHKQLKESPSLVFAVMNVGVILLGTLIGILVFKEKLFRSQYFGIFMALLSIFILFLTQLK